VTAAAFLWLCLALVAAGADWLAVYHGNRRLEFVAKPLTMVLLIGAAVAVDPADAATRYWFVVALLLSLAGDVLLMLRRDNLFVAGLGAFLLAHVAYIIGLLTSGVHAGGLLVGFALAVAGFVLIVARLMRGVRRTDRALVTPVLAYVVVISVMLITAYGTTRLWAFAGASFFYISDSLLGRQRFLEPRERGDTAVMVTYHLAQILLVLSLV
jgi:uncharacterized membrane protein YhhN